MTRDRFRPPRPLRLERLEDRTTPSTSFPLSTTAWTALGPAPIVNGQTRGKLPCTGRITGVAADPTNPDVVYAASASGGLWKTTNATAANPTWAPLTDTLASLNGG